MTATVRAWLADDPSSIGFNDDGFCEWLLQTASLPVILFRVRFDGKAVVTWTYNVEYAKPYKYATATISQQNTSSKYISSLSTKTYVSPQSIFWLRMSICQPGYSKGYEWEFHAKIFIKFKGRNVIMFSVKTTYTLYLKFVTLWPW